MLVSAEISWENQGIFVFANLVARAKTTSLEVVFSYLDTNRNISHVEKYMLGVAWTLDITGFLGKKKSPLLLKAFMV